MRLSVTGHRPDKLGGYGPEVTKRLTDFAVECLLRMHPDEVVTGMAIGWDQAIAEAALLLNMPFIAAIPFNGQETRWPKVVQQRYHVLLGLARRKHVVSPGGFEVWKMQKRNEWMVNNSDATMALWNGTSGGTKNCVDYIKKRKKSWTNVWDDWVKFNAPNSPIDRWEEI